jgi:hypothetical protein
LYKSAVRFSKEAVSCRVHIFSYNAAKLLLKGNSRFRDLSRALLDHMIALTTDPAGSALAIIAHNTAIWLVQEAVVQWQYDPRPGVMPVGIATFGLPFGLGENHWQMEQWERFRDGLLIHLNASNPKRKRYPKLDHSTIELSMLQFKQFISNLRRGLHGKNPTKIDLSNHSGKVTENEVLRLMGWEITCSTRVSLVSYFGD